jgi:hypothetical protein
MVGRAVFTGSSEPDGTRAVALDATVVDPSAFVAVT